MNIDSLSLSQLSIRVRDSEYVVKICAKEYVHFEVEFYLLHPYVLAEEDILYVLGASKEYEIIEHDLEMSEVVVPNVSLSQAQEAMASPFTFLEQQHSIVSELKTKLLSLEKSIVNSRIQESHQTTIDSYFGH